MFYGAGELPQQTGLLVSDDLEIWTKHPDNPVLLPAGPHYQADPHPRLPLWYVSFRDPCVVWDPSARW